MLLGGMGDPQNLICRGIGEHIKLLYDAQYTIDACMISQFAGFYTLDATIDWQRHIRYMIDTLLRVNCSCGYSIDAVFKLGTPTINNARSYNVYKVKVPYYD